MSEEAQAAKAAQQAEAVEQQKAKRRARVTEIQGKIARLQEKERQAAEELAALEHPAATV